MSDVNDDRPAMLSDLRVFGAQLRGEIQQDLARKIDAAFEQFRDWARVFLDPVRTTAEREQILALEVGELRRDLDAHRNDAAVHRAPPKRSRRR